jgi:environmental stress-induced protein Ves
MRILRAADHKRMPWKNGGGETTEIAVFPADAGLSDFDWRVSMARVDASGPFSSFPDIDRTLSILEGTGIMLCVEGQEPTRLVIESEPHTFPADVATSADLIGGTVIDFNVMSRRGQVEHVVERLRTGLASPAGSTRLVLCSDGSVAVRSAAGTESLGRYDAALLGKDDAAELTPGADSEFYLVAFRSI